MPVAIGKIEHHLPSPPPPGPLLKPLPAAMWVLAHQEVPVSWQCAHCLFRPYARLQNPQPPYHHCALSPKKTWVDYELLLHHA